MTERAPGAGTYCAYCTAEFPDEAPDTIAQIQAHVRVCPLHPMREVERDRDDMDMAATRYRVERDQAQQDLAAAQARAAGLEAVVAAAQTVYADQSLIMSPAMARLGVALVALATPPAEGDRDGA